MPGQDLILALSIQKLPIHKVQLHQRHIEVIVIGQKLLQHFAGGMGGKTQVANSSLRPHLPQETHVIPLRVCVEGIGILFQAMEQIEVHIVGLQPLQLLKKCLADIPFGAAIELGSKIIAFTGILLQRFA